MEQPGSETVSCTGGGLCEGVRMKPEELRSPGKVLGARFPGRRLRNRRQQMVPGVGMG